MIMNAKHSPLRTRRLLQPIIRAFCLFAIILILGSFTVSSAQPQTRINTEIRLECNGLNPTSSTSLSYKVADVFIDNQPLIRLSESVPAGRHNLRVIARPPLGKEGSWIIKKIEYRWPGGLVDSYTINQTAANVPLTLSEEDGGKISITIETCIPKDQVHLQIATTQSCSGAENEPVTKAAGVSVFIGSNTYTSNENGVIDVFLPAGRYPVGANWKDYGFGFVRQNNGIKAKSSETGLLPSVTLSEKTEMLEVRVLTCDSGGREKARAVITEMGGSIKVTRSRAVGNGFVGMQLRDGDVVVISGTAKLKWLASNGIISFEDRRGSIIVIGPDNTPEGNKAAPGRSNLEILRGLGNFFFPPEDFERDENGNIIKFRATTHTIALGVKGTVFSLGYDEQTQVSTVIVQEGVVEVTPTNPALRPFELRAGQRAEVSPTSVNGPNEPSTQDPAAGTMVKTKKPAYAPNEQIEVTYSRAAGFANDHVVIADRDPVKRRMASGQFSAINSHYQSKVGEDVNLKELRGTRTFPGLPEGEYEVRYVDSKSNAYEPIATAYFTVGKKPSSDGGGGATGDLEDNTNRRGGDYRDFDVRDNNPNQCRDACQNDPKCRAFTYMRPSYWGPNAHCFLKQSVPPPVQESCCLSGVKSGSGSTGNTAGGTGGGNAAGGNAGGSGGTQPQTGTQPAAGTQEQTVTIDVPANRAWTPTGVQLRPGDQVMVQASGVIEAASPAVQGPFYHAVPPGGRAQFHPEKPQPLLPALSMLGRIANGPVVSVGPFARWYAGPPYGSGELFLGINDDGLDDNSGAWQVRITVFRSASQPPPKQPGVITRSGGERIDWSTNAQAKGCHPGERYTYVCSAGGKDSGGIYGLDIYSTDSPICPAAVQAGVITTEKGGSVTIEMVESPPGLGAGNRNGVGSSSGAKRGPCAFKFVEESSTASGSSSDIIGLTQKASGAGSTNRPPKARASGNKPVVEEIPEDATTSSAKPRNRGGQTSPKVEEIPEDAGSTAVASNRPARGRNNPSPKVEEIPEDDTTTARPGKSMPRVEEIPETKTGASGSGGRTGSQSGGSRSTQTAETKPAKPPKQRTGKDLGTRIGEAIRQGVTGGTTTNQQPGAQPPSTNRPQAGAASASTLQLVEVTKKCSEQCGNYSPNPDAGQMTFQASYGAATFQWTVPPQQIGPDGFNMTIGFYVKGGNYAAAMQVRGSLTIEPANNRIEFYSRGGEEGRKSVTVRVRPPQNPTPGVDYTVETGADFGMSFVYHYRVVQ